MGRLRALSVAALFLTACTVFLALTISRFPRRFALALVSLVRLLALALVLLGPFLVSFHRVLRCSDH
ncbi:MAG TPA: hypothetical protein VLG28_08055 [Acidimicrobiia bacterium]|nr:hypothetical protein [Acidimicrobiia bacterium]